MMNGRYGQVIGTLGVLVAVTLLLNDFLAGLVRSNESSTLESIIHLTVIAGFLAYIAYLKHRLVADRRGQEVFRKVWLQIPCGLAIIRKDGLVEVDGNDELFNVFGLASGILKDGKFTPEPKTAAVKKIIKTEECQTSGGYKRYADRFVIPLNGYSAGNYAVEFLFEVTHRMQEVDKRESEYINMLKILVNMFEMKDPYSRGHSEVVSNLAQELAKAMNLTAGEVTAITMAALLHDIGKIIIPSEILNKTAELSVAEYDIIKTHPIVGAEILSGMTVFENVALIVKHHHERFDGKGYPEGLSGSAIPLGSRVIAVADAFDSMTAGRSVHGKRSVTATLATLVSEKGRQFDPVIVDVFVSLVRVGRIAE
jgi:putative nucleotidyltransferase with HDIG domain